MRYDLQAFDPECEAVRLDRHPSTVATMPPELPSDRTLGNIVNLWESVMDGWRGAAPQAMRAATRTRRVELRDWDLLSKMDNWRGENSSGAGQ